MFAMSEDVAVDFLHEADIGNTNAQNAGGWLPMADYDRIYAKVKLIVWDVGDNLDECRIQQGQGSGGTNAKDLTTDASGGNYDTDNSINAANETVVVEARAEDMDVDGGFDHVRLYVAEGGNTGVDEVMGVLIRYSTHTRKAEKEAAAVTGETVYVTPDS